MEKKNNKFSHPLMSDNIIKEDLKNLISFIKKTNKFTNGPEVKKFENKWSKWLGVKYSVFVNSGSSANLLSLAALRINKGIGEIIVPPLNWSSNIFSILHNGFKPKFVDINLETLGLNDEKLEDAISKKTKAIFLTHILGLNALTPKIIKLIKKYKIDLIEDCCESHGAKFKKKKIGTFGSQSNFSFYYAHHMSTIEGGMICTDNFDTYEILRMLRSHGMVREASSLKIRKKYLKKYKDLNKDFIFSYPSYNVRSTELNANLGISQLKRLTSNNLKRSRNFNLFLQNLDKDKYYVNFNTLGSVNYGLIILLNKKFANKKTRNKLENVLKSYNIEYRRGMSGGGNQLRQPYIKKILPNFKKKEFENIEFVHKYGYYIGNYPSLKKEKIIYICNLLNSI